MFHSKWFPYGYAFSMSDDSIISLTENEVDRTHVIDIFDWTKFVIYSIFKFWIVTIFPCDNADKEGSIILPLKEAICLWVKNSEYHKSPLESYTHLWLHILIRKHKLTIASAYLAVHVAESDIVCCDYFTPKTQIG